MRFGRPFQIYVTVISLLYMLFFVTAELTAVGGVVAILTGGSGRGAVVAVAVATLIYTVYGGLRASLRTDRFQAWLILALLLAAAWAVVGLSVDMTAATAPAVAAPPAATAGRTHPGHHRDGRQPVPPGLLAAGVGPPPTTARCGGAPVSERSRQCRWSRCSAGWG